MKSTSSWFRSSSSSLAYIMTLWTILLLVSSPSIVVVSAQERISAQDFYMGIQDELYDVIIDVRSENEWTTVGHIDGATFLPNLAMSGTTSPFPILNGCQSSCTLAVYCFSGNRAGTAITRFINEFGFENATLYNAGGISQWTAAGYSLVMSSSDDFSDSVIPKCSILNCENATTTTQQQQPQTGRSGSGSGAVAGECGVCKAAAAASSSSSSSGNDNNNDGASGTTTEEEEENDNINNNKDDTSSAASASASASAFTIDGGKLFSLFACFLALYCSWYSGQ